MKRSFNLLFAGALMSALCMGFTACNDSGGQEQGEDVPFAEYKLQSSNPDEEDFGYWVDYASNGYIPTPSKPNVSGVLIINSDEDLNGFVEGYYPPVDFSKKTILLAYGTLAWGFHSANVDNFSRLPDSRYRMDITVRALDTDMVSSWYVAIKTDKIEHDSEFVVNVNIPNIWPE